MPEDRLFGMNGIASVLLEPQQLVDARFVEADEHLIADHDDRHTHLTALFHHLLAFLDIFRDVMLGVGNALFIEVILGHMTKMASRGAVYHNICIHMSELRLLLILFNGLSIAQYWTEWVESVVRHAPLLQAERTPLSRKTAANSIACSDRCPLNITLV